MCCHGDKHLRVLTYKMAAKINWHRYGTQLRNCHPMYKRVLCSCDVNIPAVLHMLRNAVQFSSRDIKGASFLRLLCTARSWFAVDVSRSWCRQTGWLTHTQLNHIWWLTSVDLGVVKLAGSLTLSLITSGGFGLVLLSLPSAFVDVLFDLVVDFIFQLASLGPFF